MADDFGDKTEAPTPRRRQEAREQGNIARSPDLTAAVVLICSLILLKWYGTGVVQALQTLMAEMLSRKTLSEGSVGDIHVPILSGMMMVGRSLAPLAIGIIFCAIVANMLQTGLFFSTKRIQPNLAALNPFKGLNRLLSKGHGMIQLGMNTVKMVCVSVAAYSAIHGRMHEIVAAAQLSSEQVFMLGGSMVYSILMRVGILLLVLAIIDYIYQRYRIEKQLKMSKQEVKDEMRRAEGDPQIKQRRRQIARQMLVQKLQTDVPKADVIVTNPTHFAVALKYDGDSMHAPRVVAKGQDFIALKISEISAANGIPILERPPLSRALYKMCEVGQEIPEQFYSVVAEILAYVYELTGKVRKQSA